MSWWHAIVVVTCTLALYGAVCGVDRLERWADRRRHSRRSALERRRRAAAHGVAPKISRADFRNGVRACLIELADSDEARTIVAGARYVHRASSGDAA